MLRRLINTDENTTLKDFTASMNLYKVQEDLCDAWDFVKESTVRNSWNKLLKQPEVVPDTIDLLQLAKQVPELSAISEDEIQEWIDNEDLDPGYQIFTDDEIVDMHRTPEMKPMNSPENLESVDSENLDFGEFQEATEYTKYLLNIAFKKDYEDYDSLAESLVKFQNYLSDSLN